jgi:glycolate oxidase iron-sulfur subunit
MKAMEQTYKCGKCGICIQTCPVYQEDLTEMTTPRGKVQLIRRYTDGGLETSKNLQKVVSKCLMCGACTMYCPSGIDHEALYISMRKSMKQEHGEDWKKRLFFHLLSHENKLKISAAIASKGQNAVFEKLYKDIRLGNVKISSMPRLNKQPMRDSLPEVAEPSGGEVRGTVHYFIGCSTNYLYGSVAESTVKVLNAMGLRVKIVREQVCCGLPMYLKGAVETSAGNIQKNIELFREAETVITDCTTCGSALTSGYEKVMAELGESTDGAVGLKAKSRDLLRFINENYEWLENSIDKDKEKVKVTYHAPCHERNHGGSADALKLLNRIPVIEYVQSRGYDECCGGGGTFFYDFPELSKQMTDKKLAAARATGAELWATGCPGCRINLTGSLEDGDNMRLVHPVELIAGVLK